MIKNRILIIGDSFSANTLGWPSMIGEDITNLSQNGVGEYKIMLQARKTNLTRFETIIVCHTSPWRVHTRFHPIHHDNQSRNENDFLLSDVEYHSKHNKQMLEVKKYLEKYMDPSYQMDMYRLIVNELKTIPNSLHITFHDVQDTSIIENNYHSIWLENPGTINHMNDKGNFEVSKHIKELINGRS